MESPSFLQANNSSLYLEHLFISYGTGTEVSIRVRKGRPYGLPVGGGSHGCLISSSNGSVRHLLVSIFVAAAGGGYSNPQLLRPVEF